MTDAVIVPVYTKDDEIDAVLGLAKRAIGSTRTSLREAAEHIANAQQLKASQRRIAATVGMSVGWVNTLLKWRKQGYPEAGPFGPQAKAKRERLRNVQSLNKQSSNETSGPEATPPKRASTNLTFTKADRELLLNLIATQCREAQALCVNLGLTLDDVIAPAFDNDADPSVT